MSKLIKPKQWTKSGWFGVVVDTPPDWNLGAISGEEAEGYFRVDSSDEASVEIRWRTQKGAVDLGNILEQYIKGLRKSSKKTKIPLEFHQKPKALQGIHPMDRKPLTFSWKADRNAQGAVWACPTCDRVVIAQVSWPLEKAAPPVSRILESVVDHPQGGLATWALYDLVVKVPEDYKIQSQKLMSGYIRLEFARKASRLIVERWGLAEIALKDTTLGPWLQQKSAALLRQYRVTETEQDSHGHAGIAMEGPLKGIRRRVKALYQHILRQKPARWLSVTAWVCPDANRIFSVSCASPKEDNIAQQVADSISCHAAGDRD